MIKLVVSDIDGTLLQSGSVTISDDIFTEIRRLSQKGILFCPASGRQYSSLRKLFFPVQDQLYFLCENGAIVYGAGNPGPILSKTNFPKDISIELCHDILSHDDCEILISGADTSYIIPKDPAYIHLIRDVIGNNVVVVDSPESVIEPMIKISAYCSGDLLSLQSELSPKYAGKLTCAIAGEKWLDFTLADKGIGLSALCSSLGILPCDVIAFGDNYNDLPMLKMAGISYLMNNAAPDLLSQFDHHCDSVAEILRFL